MPKRFFQEITVWLYASFQILTVGNIELLYIDHRFKIQWAYGGFRSHGGSPRSSIFRLGFSIVKFVNQPAMGGTTFLETSI